MRRMSKKNLDRRDVRVRKDGVLAQRCRLDQYS